MTTATPTITVSGHSVRAIVSAVQSFSVLVETLLDVLRVETRDARGMRAIDPERWYPIDDYLVAYKKIDTLLGGRGLEKIGSIIPQHAILPPDVTDVHAALACLDVAFHMNHRLDGKPMFDPRNGSMLEGIGHYGYEPVPGEREVRMVCANPYPCRFDLGVVRGMAQRFEPAATVVHDATQGCRSKGSASCTYLVRW